jgi:hypothetical protein
MERGTGGKGGGKSGRNSNVKRVSGEAAGRRRKTGSMSAVEICEAVFRPGSYGGRGTQCRWEVRCEATIGRDSRKVGRGTDGRSNRHFNVIVSCLKMIATDDREIFIASTEPMILACGFRCGNHVCSRRK